MSNHSGMEHGTIQETGSLQAATVRHEVQTGTNGATQTTKTVAAMVRHDEIGRVTEPAPDVANRLWIIVICAFAVVLVGSFAVLAASVFVAGIKDTSVQI